MCMQQQSKIEATAPATTNTVTMRKEDKVIDFVSCGLDRSCPKSVTKHNSQGVRLDQYQSSIRGTPVKRQRKRIFEDCGTSPPSIHPGPPICFDKPTIMDHEFEWYDLDAIRECDSSDRNTDDCAIVVAHDFNAGLVFTTERQVLSKGAEINNVVHPSVSTKDRESKFDLTFWIHSDPYTAGEVPIDKDEREFRERMKELEDEMNSDLSSFCSSSAS